MCFWPERWLQLWSELVFIDCYRNVHNSNLIFKKKKHKSILFSVFMNVFNFYAIAAVIAVMSFFRTFFHCMIALIFADYLPAERWVYCNFQNTKTINIFSQFQTVFFFNENAFLHIISLIPFQICIWFWFVHVYARKSNVFNFTNFWIYSRCDTKLCYLFQYTYIAHVHVYNSLDCWNNLVSNSSSKNCYKLDLTKLDFTNCTLIKLNKVIQCDEIRIYQMCTIQQTGGK